MNEQRLKAVIFDWAGTVVDYGSRAPVEAFHGLFQRYGIELEEALIRRDMGMSKHAHLRALVNTPDIRRQWMASHGESVFSDDEPLYAELLQVQRETIAARAQPFAGVAALVQRLKGQGIAIGTTTGYPASVTTDLQRIAAEHGFRPAVTVTDSDVAAGRPAPWMILRACERLGVYPFREVVVVDDTVAGIEAARHAGCWAVGVSETGNLVGLTEEVFQDLDPVTREERVLEAEVALKAAGAHFVVPSVCALPDILEAIEGYLAEGRIPY